MNTEMHSSRPVSLPMDAVWDRIDPLAADFAINLPETELAVLPYFRIGGQGFERLIYELLQAEHQRPWFFGHNGQPQYGIDIVTDKGDGQTVYQCKNYKEAPNWASVKEAITKFENEWLGSMDLPSPKAFVYCCPHPLDDITFDVELMRFKEDFQRRTGVKVFFWDRHTLDTRLRRLPDIVAGLFSDSIAEHFCDCDDWRDDLWIRVQNGHARYPVINRFLDRHQRRAIYVENSQEVRFFAALEQVSAIALRGLPGTGKSFLGLELACRLKQPLRRIYYATLKDCAPSDHLWQPVRRRQSLPSIFLLDECHLIPEVVGTFLERLAPELENGKIKIILLMRDQPGCPGDEIDDSPEWLVRLKEEQALIDLRADPKRSFAITCHLRPDFTGLSRPRQKRLHHICGGDLLLLDEMLQGIDTPQEIDTLSLEVVLPKLRVQYFGGNQRLPTLAKLAGLAQFDIVPRASFFDGQWQSGEEKLADPLMTRLFAPPRYQFLHSSLAELALRALTQLDVKDDLLDKAVIDSTIRTLRCYLFYLCPNSSEKEAQLLDFILTLQQCMTASLKLTDIWNKSGITAQIVGDDKVFSIVNAGLSYCNFRFLQACINSLNVSNHPAKKHYVELVEKRLRSLIVDGANKSEINGEALNTINFAFSTLSIHAPERLNTVIEEYGASEFLHMILVNGTISTLFKLFRKLRNFTPTFGKKLLDQLTTEQVAILIDTTIASRRSIGTLDLTMFELGKSDSELLGRLEQAIGTPNFLRLILANGTLFELFRFLQHSTPEFRKKLLNRFTPTMSDALINKMIDRKRSIGTLNLTMFELGKSDAELLGRLEQTIGAQGLLRLILANGDLIDLFRFIEHSTPTFRKELLDRFTPTMADILINKMIDTKHSIGTLDFSIKELRKSDSELLGQLEQTIGAPGLLRLILANGTLVELFRVLQHSIPEFRKKLLYHITPSNAAVLIEKTISQLVRIESFHYTFKALATDGDQLSRLEQVLGIKGFWRLFIAVGSLNSVSKITRSMTEYFRAKVIAAATDLSVKDWCDIIARGLFLNACEFIKEDLATYPADARNAFSLALKGTASLLTANAKWFDLNPSRPQSDSEQVDGTILRAALLKRIQAVQLTDLFNLSFREAVNAMAICWRERTDLRPEIGNNLRNILPPPSDWPRKNGEVAAIRLVLALVRSSEFAEEDAHYLLGEIGSFLDKQVCADIETLPLFLLIWNMAALFYERGSEGNFTGAVPPALQEVLLGALMGRVRTKGSNKEKLSQLSLAGLIAFIYPQHKMRLVKMLIPIKGAIPWLSEYATKNTFVPSLFALEGIGLLSTVVYTFTPQVCGELLRKSEDYEDVGPAIEYLRQHISGRFNKAQFDKHQ
jgi:hypothetical protein